MSQRDLQVLLLRHDLISPDRLRDAVTASRASPRTMTWLERLLLLDHLDEEAVCRCVAAAYHLRRCGWDVLGAVPAGIIGLVPPEVALEYRAIPIGVDREGDLRLAMVDPGDTEALGEIGFFTGRRLLREVALASDVAAALERHYGLISALLPRLRRNDVVPARRGEPSPALTA